MLLVLSAGVALLSLGAGAFFRWGDAVALLKLVTQLLLLLLLVVVV